jgi:D-alanine-D-alanine ligase-like ATP-grasp enzyme
MKICILHPSYQNSNSPFSELDPMCRPESYYQDLKHNHIFDSVFIHKATASQQIRNLSTKEYDVFINLCDGAFDEDRAGKEVVEALEFYGLAYTGADPRFYEPSRKIQKMMAYYYGIKTPLFGFVFKEEDLSEIASQLKYPMIVKHYNGYSSIGMTKASKCHNFEELSVQCKLMINEFGGALVEEFIEGREFTALVCENAEDPLNPIVFEPIECIFPENESFKHFDLKWKEFDSIKWVKSDDTILSEKIKLMSKTMFLALNGVGYGRLDIRVDANSEPYFLEINPNCGIFYPMPDIGSADFILLNSEIGHVGFIEHIINCAIKRQKSKIKSIEVRFKPNAGYGLYATRDISIGELVHQYEEKPTNIVSKKYVDKTWKDPLKKKWFNQYAFPLTNELFSIWSENPELWLPLNHSCDPNTWLDGLNLIARKNIKVNDPIEVEYATFCTENMSEFKCQCGSKLCRGIIKGTDYLLPFVKEIYGEHVSDYVANKL